MEMTPRQRWLALFQGEKPDRIPTDYWATNEFHTRFKNDLDCPDDESLWRKLHIDRPLFLSPKPPHRAHPNYPLAEIWGVEFTEVDYGSGTYVEAANHPLAHMQSVDEIHAHNWPSPDEFDYQLITQRVDQSDGFRPIHAGHYEPFLLYCWMRGMEQSFEDLLVDPDIADAILGHIFDFYFEYLTRTFEAGKGKIDLCYVAEDLGAQTGPLMSLDTYRRFLMPNQVRMADLARKFGVHVFYHTDGAARQFIPDLINNVKIEILNPIQWRCAGMEIQGLVKDFASHVIFHGGIDNQYTLPFGSPDEVIAEVKNCHQLFAPARWICAPCHNIQAVSPTDNVLAMYQTIAQLNGLTI